MIDAYCPRHGATLLFTERRITALRNTPHGIELEILCYCGERIEILTGVAAKEPLAAGASGR